MPRPLSSEFLALDSEQEFEKETCLWRFGSLLNRAAQKEIGCLLSDFQTLQIIVPIGGKGGGGGERNDPAIGVARHFISLWGGVGGGQAWCRD